MILGPWVGITRQATWILYDLDSALDHQYVERSEEEGVRSDEEEESMRKKERRGGRSDQKEEAKRRKKNCLSVYR